MADQDPSASRQAAAPSGGGGLRSGRLGGMSAFGGGPFNIGWAPWAIGLVALAAGVIFFMSRRGTTTTTASGAPATGAQAATQTTQGGAPSQATVVPLPYPVDWAGQPQPQAQPGGTVAQQPIAQAAQPAAQSLGSITLVGQPTGGQQASQPGPPYYDPSTGQVLSSQAGPFFQWGQTVSAVGPPNAQGMVPVVSPSGGVVAIPATDVASWNNPSSQSLSSFSPGSTTA